MANHFPLRLIERREICSGVLHLVFQSESPIAYIAGQFLQIHFEHAGAPTKRSYSLANVPASTPDPTGTVCEIAVSYVEGGAASKLLFGLAPGDTLDASGPYGRFCLLEADKNARYILVGTGTGITPYRAMHAHIDRCIAERNAEFVIVQGGRTHAELLYRDEFLAQAQRPSGHMRYVGCSSREAADPEKHTLAGRVQQGLAQLQLDPARDVVYLCGNPNMVDECFNWLKEQGFPVPSVRREKYISSK